ncbi:hypothetical protein [Streptomyces violaceusniger]|uniref:DNA primase/polymerase bifunctional N-terminal domain-containing protein n=1 Tax=Streptomyces violaceusniger (strain Tu 4113) TaxID=653045 RepID=G2PGP2_STRV4|nr:hypothetical protein [Streptomyces violaceusniger]AEM88538.1 hypothetical protein Strvi_9251 [Streptomyces violaceusniger Tu 4113]
MAHGSATARKPAATPAWYRVALPTSRRRALWAHGDDRTLWAACGCAWDAVAITPIQLGLDALTAMRLGVASGYPVLADQIHDELYILVPPGTGAAATGLPGVRVLSTGSQLLTPVTEHGTPAAHWISPPHRSRPRLVPADRLTTHLRRLMAPPYEGAAAR